MSVLGSRHAGKSTAIRTSLYGGKRNAPTGSVWGFNNQERAPTAAFGTYGVKPTLTV